MGQTMLCACMAICAVSLVLAATRYTRNGRVQARGAYSTLPLLELPPLVTFRPFPHFSPNGGRSLAGVCGSSAFHLPPRVTPFTTPSTTHCDLFGLSLTSAQTAGARSLAGARGLSVWNTTCCTWTRDRLKPMLRAVSTARS